MIRILLLVSMLTSNASAQQTSKIDNRVPPEVLQVVNSALKGGEHSFFSDFDILKVQFGFNKSTKLSDVKAGDPIRRYWLDPDSVKKNNETAPISSLITLYDNDWEVPLLVDGKIVTFCEVVKNQSSGWQWIIAGEGGWGGHFLAREWQKVIKKWPSSAGYHPVFVETGREHNFFYIPEKNDSNLTYLKLIHRDNDSLEMTTDTSYSTLSNSRNLLKHLKVPHTTTRLTKSQISEIKKENEQIRRDNEQK